MNALGPKRLASDSAVSENLLPLPVPSLTHTSTAEATSPKWLRMAFAACDAFEWATFAYLGLLNLLLLFFHKNLPGAARYFFAHLALAAAIVLLCWSAERWLLVSLRFLRHWYPLALFLFLFEELHHLVHLVFSGWFDRWLIQFDYALLGAHPTLWLEQFAGLWLNDAMQFAYVTYYFYLVIVAGILYTRDARLAFRALMTSSGVAYYLGYVVSILVPIEGPYHTLAALQRVELTGGLFTAVMSQIESFGRVHGAAFPSSHVAGSVVPLLAAWFYRRRLGSALCFWLILPFFLAMLVSTVYGRYHYVADVLAGLATGALGFSLVHSLFQRSDPSGADL